ESPTRPIEGGTPKAIFEAVDLDEAWPTQTGHEDLIAQMDGGMVPTVEPDAAQKDKRKGKKLVWKEAKICLAHAKGSTTLAFGGTLQGDALAAGQNLFACARAAGFGTNSRLHAVGGGGPWIADQVEQRFGTQGSYLIDFFHVCEYLSPAAQG